MAGGAGGNLVPHQLPDGRTIMVPGYLAGPAAPGPGMANAAAADPMEAAARMQALQPSPQEQQVANIRSALAPKAPAPGANEHKPTGPSGPGWMPRGEAKDGGGGAVDPSTLAEPGGGKAPAQSGGDSDEPWNPLVRQVFNEGGGGGGGGPRRTGRREETSVTAERLPGKELLPELQWAMGIADRPQELDPDKPFVADDPQYRGVQTGVTRGAEAAGKSARAMYEQQANFEQQKLNAEREVLVQQSQALDQNLAQVAERRNRIAQLQETADKRMEEARSFEPRTRKQVWQEMGKPAQIMGVIAMALGGYAVGTGRAGRNMGMDMVNKLIDDAVDDDRSKAEKRLKLGQAAKSDYEHALTLYGDPEAAALEAKQRKLASTMGMLQNQLASQSLDAQAKQRGEQLYAQAEQQYLQNAQQLYDQLNGVVVKESINYKPEMVGGGGGGMTTLKRLENAARAKKAYDTVTGQDGENKPGVSPAEVAAMNNEEADMIPLKELLQKYRNSDSIPGVKPHNVASRAARGVVDFVGGAGSGSRTLDSDEERTNRIIVERAALAYRHKVTGAGGSAKEMEGIDQAFAGARTKRDLEEAVRIAERTLAERRRLAAGGKSQTVAPARAASEEPAR